MWSHGFDGIVGQETTARSFGPTDGKAAELERANTFAVKQKTSGTHGRDHRFISGQRVQWPKKSAKIRVNTGKQAAKGVQEGQIIRICDIFDPYFLFN